MTRPNRVTVAILVVVLIGALLRVLPFAAANVASWALTFGCLLAGAIGAGLVALRSGGSAPQRWGWLAIAACAGLYAAGQVVFTYYLLANGGKILFPSPADVFAVTAGLSGAAAMFVFAVNARRSGLPFGGVLGFWSPALAVLLVALVAAYPGVALARRNSATSLEMALKIYYPGIDFVILAASAVMVRVAVKFRGGRLLWTWMPIALGATASCLSDILFNELSSANGEVTIAGVIDVLYFVGAVGLLYGILNQLHVVTARPAAG
jgi:two-component system, sensor histidine kinase and response regulator